MLALMTAGGMSMVMMMGERLEHRRCSPPRPPATTADHTTASKPRRNMPSSAGTRPDYRSRHRHDVARSDRRRPADAGLRKPLMAIESIAAPPGPTVPDDRCSRSHRCHQSPHESLPQVQTSEPAVANVDGHGRGNEDPLTATGWKKLHEHQPSLHQSLSPRPASGRAAADQIAAPPARPRPVRAVAAAANHRLAVDRRNRRGKLPATSTAIVAGPATAHVATPPSPAAATGITASCGTRPARQPASASGRYPRCTAPSHTDHRSRRPAAPSRSLRPRRRSAPSAGRKSAALCGNSTPTNTNTSPSCCWPARREPDRGSIIGVGSLHAGDGATTTLLVPGCGARRSASDRSSWSTPIFGAPRLAGLLGVQPTTSWQDVLEQGLPVAEAVIRAENDGVDLLPLDLRAPTAREPNGAKLAAGLQTVDHRRRPPLRLRNRARRPRRDPRPAVVQPPSAT